MTASFGNRRGQLRQIKIDFICRSALCGQLRDSYIDIANLRYSEFAGIAIAVGRTPRPRSWGLRLLVAR